MCDPVQLPPGAALHRYALSPPEYLSVKTKGSTSGGQCLQPAKQEPG